MATAAGGSQSGGADNVMATVMDDIGMANAARHLFGEAGGATSDSRRLVASRCAVSLFVAMEQGAAPGEALRNM